MPVSVQPTAPASPADASPPGTPAPEARCPGAAAIAEAKRALRVRLLEERAARPLDHAAGLAAGKAAAALLARLERRPGVIAAYWPMRDEVDLRPVLAALHGAGWQCALPVVAGPRRPLQFRRWQPGDALHPSRFGVQEPGPNAAAATPDVVLVPLLAFDDDGYRLGYGGGFYDRTLAALRAVSPGLLVIGVGLERQRHHPLPRDGHDQALPWVVTERGPRQYGT